MKRSWFGNHREYQQCYNKLLVQKSASFTWFIYKGRINGMQRLFCLMGWKWMDKKSQFLTKIVSTMTTWATRPTKFPSKVFSQLQEKIFVHFSKKNNFSNLFGRITHLAPTPKRKENPNLLKNILVITKKTVLKEQKT